MSSLIAVQQTLLSLTDTTAASVRRATTRVRSGQDRQAGLSTLEIAIIALGLFLLAGIAVLVITNATNTRLDQIQ